MDKYRIYCLTHFDSAVVNDPLYTRLHTGQAYDKMTYPGLIGDDSGDSISEKKGEYDGPLTGMYWIWKNTNHAFKGMCTYRGYLGINDRPMMMSDMDDIFLTKGYDFVVARYDTEISSGEYFELCHPGFFYNHLHNPIKYAERIISKYYPDMQNAYSYCMEHNILNYRHTYICKRELFDSYAEWLFGFIEKFAEFSRGVNYEIGPRFYGYLAERLERVWILSKDIKVMEVPIVYVSDRQ